MDAFIASLLLIAALLVGVRLVFGPGRKPVSDRHSPTADDFLEDDHSRDEPELGSVESLVRWGTPETVEELVAQGRADELRGLGYQGELPDN